MPLLFNQKNNAPPPRNGSKYRLNEAGMNSFNLDNNCVFPPAHFTKGEAFDV